MKTTIKITMLAVIIVLTALACEPEFGLTRRDFSDIRDAKNPKYENVTSGANVPSVTVGSLTYVAPPDNPTEAQRELSINFPNSADILRGNITTTALKEFISLFTYTNPALPDTSLSLKGPNIDFEFVRRARNTGANNETVVIRLATVPDTTMQLKIDAIKYTFANGLKLDYNDDGIAGNSILDDVYIKIEPANITESVDFVQQRLDDFTLFIFALPETDPVTLTEQDIYIAYADLGTYASADLKSQTKKILEDVSPRIKLQKYDMDGKTWADTGTVTLYDSNPTSTTAGVLALAVNITPQDGDIYRAYAAGMKNLTTTEDFLGIRQKIKVSGGSKYGVDNASYKYNTVISDPVLFNKSGKITQTATPVDNSYPINVSSDASGKNVKLEIYFKGIDVTADGVTTTNWLSELDGATFKKNVKLAYNRASPGNAIGVLNTSTKLDDLVFIPIKEASYDSHNPKNLTPAPGTNRITVTLDPAYQISQNGNRAISLLLAPGFKYADDLITFGDSSAAGLSVIIDGTSRWRAYGAIGNLQL